MRTLSLHYLFIICSTLSLTAMLFTAAKRDGPQRVTVEVTPHHGSAFLFQEANISARLSELAQAGSTFEICENEGSGWRKKQEKEREKSEAILICESLNGQCVRETQVHKQLSFGSTARFCKCKAEENPPRGICWPRASCKLQDEGDERFPVQDALTGNAACLPFEDTGSERRRLLFNIQMADCATYLRDHPSSATPAIGIVRSACQDFLCAKGGSEGDAKWDRGVRETFQKNAISEWLALVYKYSSKPEFDANKDQCNCPEHSFCAGQDCVEGTSSFPPYVSRTMKPHYAIGDQSLAVCLKNGWVVKACEEYGAQRSASTDEEMEETQNYMCKCPSPQKCVATTRNVCTGQDTFSPFDRVKFDDTELKTWATDFGKHRHALFSDNEYATPRMTIPMSMRNHELARCDTVDNLCHTLWERPPDEDGLHCECEMRQRCQGPGCLPNSDNIFPGFGGKFKPLDDNFVIREDTMCVGITSADFVPFTPAGEPCDTNEQCMDSDCRLPDDSPVTLEFNQGHGTCRGQCSAESPCSEATGDCLNSEYQPVSASETGTCKLRCTDGHSCGAGECLNSKWETPSASDPVGYCKVKKRLTATCKLHTECKSGTCTLTVMGWQCAEKGWFS